MSLTGGGGLARVLNLRVCRHLIIRVARAGGEERIYVLPWYRPVGVVSTSSETHGGKTGLPRVSGRHVVRVTTVPTYPCPNSCRLYSGRWGAPGGKAGENGQNSGNGAARSPLTRPSVPRCGDTSKASASSCSIWGGDPEVTWNLAPGSQLTGSPAVGTPLLLERGDVSMCSQAYARASRGRHSWRTGPSVAVRDRGH